MGKKIELSIIIVNFNALEYLKKCLDSIFASTLSKKDYEVIVFDNASSDNSAKYIKNKYSRVKLIESKKNVGFSAANNKAIKTSIGEYVLLLNPDTIVPKETLAKMLDFMKSNSRAGVATCFVRLANGKIDDASHRGFPTPFNALCHFLGISKLFPKSRILNGYHLGYQDLDKLHQIDSCCGAFMLIRRLTGRQVGWLDEDYFWYGEDLDFCYRAKKNNWQIFFVPVVEITHFKGISSGIKKHSQKISTADKRTIKEAQISRFKVMKIFYKKHYQKTYPKWLTTLVLMGIKVKEYLTLRKYKL